MADGSYNMRFKLYSQDTAGTALWSEVRQSSQQVTVQNGLFSIQLGDVTALDPALFTTYPLYLEVELPTPATIGCTEVGCSDWSEGPMSPRNPVGAAPQAMNADMIDGLDSSALAKLASGNTFTSTNLFKADNANAFAVQNTNGDSLLTADTTGMKVTVGNSTNGVDLSVNGISLKGNARSTRTVSLIPEFPGSSFQADGADNKGTLTSDFCSANLVEGGTLPVNTTQCGNAVDTRSYYQWTSSEATNQDYDIYVRYRLPSDYDTGSMTNLVYESQSSKTGQVVDFRMFSSGGLQCSQTISETALDSYVPNWISFNQANPIPGACATIPANSFVVFKIKLKANGGGIVRMGEISFTYRGKF